MVGKEGGFLYASPSGAPVKLTEGLGLEQQGAVGQNGGESAELCVGWAGTGGVLVMSLEEHWQDCYEKPVL